MLKICGSAVTWLYRWRKKYTPDGDKTEMAQQQDEMHQLRLRNAELEEKNCILKKAAAFFAQHQK
ncbi:V-type ATPase 116kDa subunit family protein [Ethanoligenens harbinense]|uniref:V-type ATPase 116kDa subunit family protein n=1 Tax=Ethanoligenens harbinense TaxID=253239 RepID=UPI0002F24D82|nr:V-type ATPase 116kDa subunit family protein [Ethanoligenens harbinense]